MDVPQGGQNQGDRSFETDAGKPDISKSTLSATAAVFVPRFAPAPAAPPAGHHQPAAQYQQQPPMYSQQVHQNNRNMNQNRNYEADQSDPMEQLRHVVKVTMASPGTFDEMITPLTETLNKEIQQEKILKDIVDELFIQSVRESNFRYTGARICNVFSNHLHVSFSNGNFCQLLQARCDEEHSKHEELLSQLQTRAHVIGFTIFLAELLANMQGQAVTAHTLTLVTQIRALMHTFLKKTDDGCLRCVVQTLKLSGTVLEDVEKSENDGKCPGLDEVFEKIKTVLLQEQLSRSAKAMLLSVVELRAKDWGRKEAESQVNGSQQMSQQLPQVSNLTLS